MVLDGLDRTFLSDQRKPFLLRWRKCHILSLIGDRPMESHKSRRYLRIGYDTRYLIRIHRRKGICSQRGPSKGVNTMAATPYWKVIFVKWRRYQTVGTNLNTIQLASDFTCTKPGLAGDNGWG